MNRRGETDDFERLLGAALDPGEIGLTDHEKSELLATTDFMGLLARELDPGEIEFEPARRKDLVARLSSISKDEDLTAWALGELPVERRMPLEARMDGEPDLRAEGLAIRNFCHRAELLLPPVAAPGWWERRRLRRVFSEVAPRRHLAGLAAAAAVVVLSLVLFPRQKPPGLPVTAGVVTEERVEIDTPSVLPDRVAELPVTREVVEVARQSEVVPEPGSKPYRRALEGVPGLGEPADVGQETAFVFSAAPRWPGLELRVDQGPAADLEELLVVNLKGRADVPLIARRTLAGTRESASGLLANLDGSGPLQSPRLSGGSRDLVSAAIAIARSGDLDPGPDPDVDPDADAGHSADGGVALPAVTPETGPLILAQSQPYLLSALLRGPVSGRTELSRSESGGWLSADFQAMDLNLPSGKGGVESDSWRIEAGMSWLLSPSWQAGVSLAGIDSRMEVPGFGSVDAEGAAFSWSLDWRENGYHAALTHTLGTFDQDLRRQAGGMLYPAGQDATVQLLALWMTKEFEAGCWTHGPVAGVEGSWGSLEGYQEAFAGGVSVAGRDFGLVTSLVGWQMSGRIDTAAGDWLPHAVLGWRHRSVLADAGMAQGGAAGNFVVPPVSPERDSLLLEGGLRWVPPGGALFFDAVSSMEWRDGGDSENSLLFKLGYQF
jgi:hypothetical protein